MLKYLPESLLVRLVAIIQIQGQSEEFSRLSDCQVAFAFHIELVVYLFDVLPTIADLFNWFQFDSPFVVVKNYSKNHL